MKDLSHIYVKINVRNLTATLKILTGVPAVTVWLLLSHYGLRLMCSLSLLQLCWLFMERYSYFKNGVFQKKSQYPLWMECWKFMLKGRDVKTSRNPCQLSKYLAILLCQVKVWIFSGISQWNGVLVNILVSPAGLSLKHSINFIISVSTGQGWKKLASTNNFIGDTYNNSYSKITINNNLDFCPTISYRVSVWYCFFLPVFSLKVEAWQPVSLALRLFWWPFVISPVVLLYLPIIL